jgi:hypothetical protein
MTGNSGAPLEHLASVTACKAVGCGFGSKVGFTSWDLGPPFFANGAEVGGGRGVREPGASPAGVPSSQQPTPFPLAPGPPRRLAAQGAGREGGALHPPPCYYPEDVQSTANPLSAFVADLGRISDSVAEEGADKTQGGAPEAKDPGEA